MTGLLLGAGALLLAAALLPADGPRRAPADLGAPARRAIGGALLGAVLLHALVGSGALAAGALAGAATGWIQGRRLEAARERRAQSGLRRDLPDALELLAAAADGGAPLVRAVEAVARHVPPPLGPALGRAAAAAASASGPPLADALLREGPVLRSLGALVAAVEDLGTPVAGALRTLAADERERLRLDARERAAAASPKMMLVVGTLLAPAALLLIVAGELLGLLASAGDIGL